MQGSTSKKHLTHLEEFKGTELSSLSSTASTSAGEMTKAARYIRSNVYSQVENTGIPSRDGIRRRLVKIFREYLTNNSQE